ncbi:MAG: glycosyl hydrolase [Gemmatimonadota bacterium]|nr:glycosyl hydrolase [Gemmatimonadota bacterium]
MLRTTIRLVPSHAVTAPVSALVPAALALSPPAPAAAQPPQPPDPALVAEAARGLALRGIGPALMGGRIADIAVHPGDPATWYVAVGSGGVWKTANAGTSWTPVFDDQPSYSIGDVAIDPSDPDVVWVGTGENVSGRHVAWGDGVYRSRDGGRTWRHMGLAASDHIGKILVDPRDGNTVFVAAEGPLWSSGGERGLYRTDDGGNTWQAVLTVDENTGVTDVEFDAADPEIMYAATYDRRRTVWSLLAGGPGSGIHKSTDGGRTWRRVTTGLPGGDMGKIGIDVSPADRNVVYATVEAGPRDRGFYRSADRGESWERRNSYISGGTGPHYYQEIEASPHDPDLVYQMDVFVHVTRDGGATFAELGTGREAHSDNHAFWIDPANGRHILAGTDAGLYETFDEGMTWRHFPNLPVSQFYKLCLDNVMPFYHIMGGAQDLGTLLGPSRTLNMDGVRNQDWSVPLGADGHACAFDPFDPNLAYVQSQRGNLQRLELSSRELINIRPLPSPGDPPERWNWDTPLIVSVHSPGTIYHASQRLWRSDDRGDSWRAVSGDLTRGDNRYELPVAGRVRSIDALWGNTAMSWYSTISAISESPVAEGVLYAGTDDGLVQASEDGGENWRLASPLPGVPERAYVNDVKASQHNRRTVFVAADNHKEGDYEPYLFESNDHGLTWRSITGDLPGGTIVWSVEQDHEYPDLLFVGTEHGVHFTPNRGANWIPLDAGAPTISFRDLEIQRRDDDLAGATFGRGFYILDDYSPLRDMARGALAAGAVLFPVRDAWWYVPHAPMQAPGQPTLGTTAFTAPNPDFGATFTYWLADPPATMRDERRKAEKAAAGRGEDIAFPGYERLRAEELESGPRVAMLVRDEDGQPVRRVMGPATRGLHRVAWDLRRPAPDPVDLEPPGFSPPWAGPPRGPLAPPGRYTVEMALVTEAGIEPLGTPRSFTVKPVLNSPPGTDHVAAMEFARETAELQRRARGAAAEIGRARDRLRHMRAALDETPRAGEELFRRLETIDARLAGIAARLQGDPGPGRLNQPGAPSIMGRIGQVAWGHWGTRQEPTETQRASLAVAREGFSEVAAALGSLLRDDLAALERDMEAAGAPWTPGRGIG